MLDDRFHPYQNPLRDSELPYTGSLKADLLFDLAEFWSDIWSTFLKTVAVFVIALSVLHLHYEMAMEVSLLLGVADICTKKRQFRVAIDMRNKLPVFNKLPTARVAESAQSPPHS